MDAPFDDLARSFAAPMPRRRALTLMAACPVGIALGLRPGRAHDRTLLLPTLSSDGSSTGHISYDPVPGPSRWGPGDEAGSSNTQTAEKVLEAKELITRGRKYLLGHVYESAMPTLPGNTWELEIKPPIAFGSRQIGHFDFLHSEIGQNGTQFDALGHAGTRSESDFVFYNGFTEDDVYGAKGLLHLGVEKMNPFFTRGVLVDVKRYVNNGATLSPGQEITIGMVSRALAAQGMTERDITEGDAVLFLTGWEENWYKGTTAYYAGVLGLPGATPGLGLEVATWLASKSVGVVGADNYAVDRVPNPDAPEGVPFPVHNELIVKSGIPLQESMRLSELANDLAVDLRGAKQAGAGAEALRKIYTFAYIYVPVPIKGATGSPGLPMAVR